MYKFYFSLKSFLTVFITFFLFFGIIFPVIKHFFPHFFEFRQVEIIFFICLFFLVTMLWFFIANRRIKTDQDEVDELKLETTGARVSVLPSLSVAVIFFLIYLLIAFWGTRSNFVVVDIFNNYKEFGYHLSAVFRFIHGSYPWIDFSYSYGFYQIFLTSLIWDLIHSADAIIYVLILMNLSAVLIFVFTLRRDCKKTLFFSGIILLFIYLIPFFPTSFYGGIHANWLRYLSPALLVLVFPCGKYIQSKTLLWGFCAGAIFFIAPELLLFLVVAIPISVAYLIKSNNFKNLKFYLLGLIFSSIPLVILMDFNDFTFERLIAIFNNIYLQAKLIIHYDLFTLEIPNLLFSFKDFLFSPSFGQVKNLYFDALYFMPLFIVVWLSGLLFITKRRKDAWYKIFILLIAIFVIFIKSLGYTSLGYAFLSIPLIILAVSITFSNLKADGPKTSNIFSNNLFAPLFLFFLIFPVSLYSLQQQYLPCLFNQGWSCGEFKIKSLERKMIVPLESAGSIQRYYESDTFNFLEVVNFLRAFRNDRILVLNDLSILYYYIDYVPDYKFLSYSLYNIEEDMESIDSTENVDVIVLSHEQDWNWINKDIQSHLPNIFLDLKKRYIFIDSCGPFDFYLNRDVYNEDVGDEYLNC